MSKNINSHIQMPKSILRKFEEYTDLYCECSSILQETAFTYGVRLGIKILLDALTNN